MATEVEVVAAVLFRADGSYLLAQRPEGKVYSGYWEFPGGKVEPGETHLEAIRREIREELGVTIEHATPWILRRHVYEHASVRIRFFRVDRWSGEPRSLDRQAFAFQTPGAETVGPMLPANGPILNALRLPSIYAITDVASWGESGFLARLELALAAGLRLVQLRDKTAGAAVRSRVALEIMARCREHGAKLLVNDDAVLARSVGADGLHLSAAALRRLKTRPDFALVAASVHDVQEVERAQSTGCDFVVLGSVKSTPTHPGAATLGWIGFRKIAESAELPVFALGGMTRGDIEAARESGAHGVAMIRGAWS